MALIKNLMGNGMPGSLATALGFGDEATGLVATGSLSTDALQLSAGINIFSTVAASTGAILPSGSGQVAIINGGAQTLTVYPGVGKQVNNATVSTGGYSVPAASTGRFETAGSLRWIATLST